MLVYGERNEGMEMLSNFPRVTQLVIGGGGF